MIRFTKASSLTFGLIKCSTIHLQTLFWDDFCTNPTLNTELSVWIPRTCLGRLNFEQHRQTKLEILNLGPNNNIRVLVGGRPDWLLKDFTLGPFAQQKHAVWKWNKSLKFQWSHGSTNSVPGLVASDDTRTNFWVKDVGSKARQKQNTAISLRLWIYDTRLLLRGYYRRSGKYGASRRDPKACNGYQFLKDFIKPWLLQHGEEHSVNTALQHIWEAAVGMVKQVSSTLGSLLHVQQWEPFGEASCTN